MYIQDRPGRAGELEALGVDAIFIHCGFDEANYHPERKQYHGVGEVLDAVKTIPVGVACDLKEDALEAVKLGVHWVTFGLPILASPENLAACKEYVDAIHNARN